MAEYDDSLVTVSLNSGINKRLDDPAGQESDSTTEKVLRPFLVEDSTLKTLPPNLVNIFENLIQNGGSNTNKNDLLVSILYVLMIETGFSTNNSKCDIDTTDFHKDRILNCDYLPDNWKNYQNQTYKFDLVLQFCKEKVCKMFCVPVQNIMNVNIIFDGEIKYVYAIPINRYVVSEEAPFFPLKFRNLRELSVIFKDNIALKAKYEILKDLEITDAILEDMPTEILYKIFQFLRVKDFSKLLATCQRMRDFEKCFDDILWKYYMERDFPNENIEAGENSWKEKYKIAFEKKRKRDIVSTAFCLR